MARRIWVWALGAGLWCCLGTGCLNPFPDLGRGTVPEQPPPPVHSDDIQNSVPDHVSPYASFPPVMPRTEPFAPPEWAVTATGSAKAGPASAKTADLGPPADGAPDLSLAASADTTGVAKVTADPNLVAALRYFLDRHPDEALERLKVYDKDNQDLLLGLFPLLSRLTEGSLSRAKSEEIENLVNSFDTLLEPLRARLPLTIGKLCFCRKIGSFGDYEPLPENHGFRRDDQAQLYIELRNFHTRECRLPGGELRYVIQLASSYKIVEIREDKKPPRTVLEGPFLRDRTEGAEASRTLRHDYFENYSFPVPNLPPGPYNLVIQVEDRGTTPPRTVQHSLYFRVTNAYLPPQDT